MMMLTAPAKLNLFLHITGRRQDGYHLLESLFVFTELGDQIHLAPSDTLSLEIKGPFSSGLTKESLQDNLVIRAAKRLQEKCAVSNGAAITLIKQIPIGAGLGGGSSDAASTLKGLNTLWGLNLSESVLHELALSLGADVPACLVEKPVIVSGIGDMVDLFSLPFNIPVLLVYPNVSLSTKDVFSLYQKNQTSFTDPIKNICHVIPNWPFFLSFLREKHNDLQSAAIALEPGIDFLLTQLSQLPDCALSSMSGSGSTCFALFTSMESCQRAEKELQSLYPTYWIKSTQIKGCADH